MIAVGTMKQATQVVRPRRTASGDYVYNNEPRAPLKLGGAVDGKGQFRFAGRFIPTTNESHAAANIATLQGIDEVGREVIEVVGCYSLVRRRWRQGFIPLSGIV